MSNPVNLYTLQNSFWTKHESNQFSVQSISMYFFILHLFNKQRWPDCIKCTDEYLAAVLHTSRNTIRKARDRLVGDGLISFVAGGVGQNSPTKYFLSDSSVNTNENTYVNTNQVLSLNTKEDSNNNQRYGSYIRKPKTRLEQRCSEIKSQQIDSIMRIKGFDDAYIQQSTCDSAASESIETIGLPRLV